MELRAVLTPDDESEYIALNPETLTTTRGETIEEAEIFSQKFIIPYHYNML